MKSAFIPPTRGQGASSEAAPEPSLPYRGHPPTQATVPGFAESCSLVTLPLLHVSLWISFQPGSVRGGPGRLQRQQFRLGRIHAGEAGCGGRGSSPGRWWRVAGGLSRQQQVPRMLQARGEA